MSPARAHTRPARPSMTANGLRLATLAIALAALGCGDGDGGIQLGNEAQVDIFPLRLFPKVE